MDIRIRKGVPTVRMMKSEINSIRITLGVCAEINSWVADPLAAAALEKLTLLYAKYCPLTTPCHPDQLDLPLDAEKGDADGQPS